MGFLPYLETDCFLGAYSFFGRQSASTRILIPCDNIGATFHLSFGLPLLNDIRNGKIAVCAGPSLKLGISPEQLITDFSPTHLILSRAFGQEIENLVSVWGRPYAYHIDDNLIELPISLGNQIVGTHGRPEVIDSRRRLLKNAELIYASTTPLKNILRSIFPDSNVVSGIYAPYLADQIPDQRTMPNLKGVFSKLFNPNRITLGYMGSKGHYRDLEMILPSIRRILKNNSNIRFETFGTIDIKEAFADLSEQFCHHAAFKDYMSFLSKLRTLEWDYGLAPIVDDTFNRCKAPTKYIEYTASNIVTIASNTIPYCFIESGKTGFLIEENRWEEDLQRIVIEKPHKQTLIQARELCRHQFSLNVLRKQLSHLLGI